MKNILSIKNVSYSYHTQEGETPALTDISFDVSSGSFTCIVGPSGCGKSTLLSLISWLLHPDSGEIYINGCSSSGSLLHIGYMLQKDSLLSGVLFIKMSCLVLKQEKCSHRKKRNLLIKCLKLMVLPILKM